MDRRRNDPCKTCGSTSFEEIEALYYCTICSTQVTGLTIEVSHFDGALNTLREVREGPRKRKKVDTGVPWTTMEAFNIILAHQCSQLESKLNLGPQFKITLFSLWAEYLSKCEVAFTGDGQFKPKISITSHLRDIQLIDQGLEKVSKPISLAHKPKEISKVGNTKLLRCVTIRSIERNYPTTDQNGLASDVDSLDRANSLKDANENINENGDEDVDENLEPGKVMNKNVEIASTAGDSNFLYNYKYQNGSEDFKVPEVERSSETDSKFSNAQTIPASESGSQRQPESNEPTKGEYSYGLTMKSSRQWTPIYRDKKNEIRSVLKAFEEGRNFEDLMGELGQKYKEEDDGESSSDEEDHTKSEKTPGLTRRSLLIKQAMIKTDKRLSDGVLRYSSDITMERMTIHKTIQFLLLAFRLCKYNVHASDIIHWINMGHLTFFNAQKLLPDEWILLPGGDVNVINSKKTVNISNFERFTMTLKNFLSIKDLPHPSFVEMIKRHVFELNLPLQLVDIIASMFNWQIVAKIAFHFKIDEKATITPAYDVYSFCIIIVVLKRLFILNNEAEYAISSFVENNWPDSFIWKNWFQHSCTLWKLMNHHYLPINSTLNSTAADIEVIRCHRDKISNSWFGIDSSLRSKRYSLTTDFKENLSKLMKESFESETCTTELPPFTVYHLYEAKKFISRRLEKLNRSSSILEENFTTKSIDYLFDETYTFIGADHINLPSSKESWDSVIREWPDPLLLLLNLGSFILNRPPKVLVPLVKRLDLAAEKMF